MTLAGILFDKDGTLVDFDASWGGAMQAVSGTMARGRPEVAARLAEAMHFVAAERRFLPTSPMIAGSTAEYAAEWAAILGRTHDDAFVDELDRRFGEAVLADLRAIGTPAAVFATLKARGLVLGIATNDAERSARAQCEILGLMPFLSFVAGYDTGHGGKPDPGMVTAFARHLGVEPGRVALVGDSVHDLEAARAAGAVAVAVLTGPAARAVLAPHADHVIGGLTELPDLVAALEAAG